MIINILNKFLVLKYPTVNIYYKVKNAFTLAEVLLTLLVIGIVASLSIPNLINDIQNKDIQVQLKKTYSILSDALKTVTLQNGNVPYQCAYIDNGKRVCNCPDGVTCDSECFTWVGDEDTGHWVNYNIPDPSVPDRLTSECSSFGTALKSQLRIIKSCTNAYAQGCLANVKTQAEILAGTTDYNSLSYKEQQKQLRSCGDQAAGYKSGPAYVLSNGAVVFPLTEQKISIDVNGLKGPNKWGYDIVQFSVRMTLDSHNMRIAAQGGCNTVEAGGQTTSTLLMQALNN